VTRSPNLRASFSILVEKNVFFSAWNFHRPTSRSM